MRVELRDGRGELRAEACHLGLLGIERERLEIEIACDARGNVGEAGIGIDVGEVRGAHGAVKAAKGSIGRSLDQPDRTVRLYLFHGPDEGQSRALGERLLRMKGVVRMADGRIASVEAPSRRLTPAELSW